MEEWSDSLEAYVPTNELLGYRAYSEDGTIFGWGDTADEARDCLRRILWRVQQWPPQSGYSVSKSIASCTEGQLICKPTPVRKSET